MNTFKEEEKKFISPIQIDLCNKEVIKAAAEKVKKEHGKLDVLINNAGMAYKGNAFDAKGWVFC